MGNCLCQEDESNKEKKFKNMEKTEQQKALLDKEKNDDEKKEVKQDDDTKTMKALVCVKKDTDIEKSIQLQEKEIPSILKDNDLLIKILYASMNPVDYKLLEMKFDDEVIKAVPLFTNSNVPFVVGFDFSGEIIKLGKNVDKNKFKVGDKVCGQAINGTFAEYTTIDANYAFKFDPKKLSVEDAAAIPLVGITSYQALFEAAKIKKTDKLLILGGTSATGRMAIQLARNFGVETITVTSSQEKVAKDLGATDVINYRNEKYFEKIKDKEYDIVYDCVDAEDTWENAKKVLKNTGTFVTIPGEQKETKPDEPKFIAFVEDVKTGMPEIIDAAQNKKLSVDISDEIYTFDNAKEMIAKVKNGKSRGQKLLLKIAK